MISCDFNSDTVGFRNSVNDILKRNGEISYAKTMWKLQMIFWDAILPVISNGQIDEAGSANILDAQEMIVSVATCINKKVSSRFPHINQTNWIGVDRE